MKNGLLTNDEINSILKESANSKYQIDNLFHLGGAPTSIQRISKRTGLILIKGNESTGLDHIMVRHHPTSKAGHWSKGEKIRLENPSKFSLGTIPIYDLLTFADEVFKEENKITDHKNTDPETFDLFIGKHTDRKNRIIEYRLLLYKGTLIIHNIYPTKGTFNKKRGIDLRQGFTKSTLDDKRGIHTYCIPYYDKLNIERAKVVIRLYTHNGQESWNIQINSKEGQPIFTHLTSQKKVDNYLEMPFRLISLDYHEDLSQIEKTMKELIKQVE